MDDPRTSVLELLTVPMRMDGLSLFPLRFAARMPRIRADFLTYSIGEPSVQSQVESMGGRVYVAPNRLRHPVRYIRFVAQTVRKNGYSLVHAHGNSCTLAIDLLAAKLGGARVRIAHAHNSSCKFTLLHRLLRPMFDHLYTHAMACGDEAGRWLFGSRPYTVVHNAVDTAQFAFSPEKRREVRAELNLKDSWTLGCVAAFNPVKNQSFLIDVLALLLKRRPDCVLVLIGDGEMRPEIEGRVHALGLDAHVRFTGIRTDVPRLLQAMDVMLLPSLYEGFPTVALEWQAAGLPALLSDFVTRDCAVAQGVQFLPLETDRWVDALCSLPEAGRPQATQSGATSVARAGYDLASAAEKLQETYLHLTDASRR